MVKRPPKRLLTAERNESWRVDVLNLDGEEIDELDGVEGGSFDLSVHNRIRSGGSLDYTGDPLDWNQVLLRVWYLLKDTDGEEYGWPIGTYIPASPVTTYVDGGQEISIELYDKLLILDDSKVSTTWSIDKGEPIMPAIGELIRGASDYHVSITGDDTDEVARSSTVWEPGTPRLTIINDLLDSIGFFALWCDGMGTYRADRNTAASSRPISFEFRDDQDSIYSADFTHDRDGFDVPNQVVGMVEGDDEEEGLIATAEDTDPDSPWSRPTRGRWVTRVLEDTDATSQQVLTDRVERALKDGQQVGSKFEIEHDLVPIDLNNAVGFRRDEERINVRGVIQTMSITADLEGGSIMNSTLREVAS